MLSKKKPRAAFLLSGYGVYRRGAEIMVEELSRRLAGEFEVKVLCRAAGGEERVRIRALDREGRLLKALDRCPLLGHALRFFQLGPLNMEWMTSCWGALPWLLKKDCDVFIPEAGVWGGLLGRFLRRVRGIPFVDIGHGAISRWEISAARQRPDVYVATTHDSARAIQQAVPGVRTQVIPVGVDAQRFHPDGPACEVDLPRPRVLCVGALEDIKRVDLVIRAMEKLGRGSLLVLGDGPLREEIVRLGLEHLGPERFACRTASQADMPGWYRACDVLASASRSEAFGLVYLEAMACNRPVVTQDDPIRREVVGEAGVFCDCASPDSFAQALSLALERDWAGLPRKTALSRDWPAVVEQYAALLKKLALPQPKT